MIARRTAHAAAGLIRAYVNLPRPLRLRETVYQTLSILLLIVGAKRGIRLSTMIAGADAVLLVVRVCGVR